jgi:uncharacterized protein (TIGR00369 family)
MSPPDEDHDRVERLARINRTFADAVPHNRALGMQIDELSAGLARLSLPWREDLVGNPGTGVLHGGVITSLMDACCGAAVFMSLRKPMPIATLDLRIDYLRPASPHETVLARAECFKVTRNVAFVRGVAYHDDESRLIASAAGSFMLGTNPGGARRSRS